MKYIREVNDIHLDFDVTRWYRRMQVDIGEARPSCDMDLLWYPEKMEGDDDTCMIISGDLWFGRKFIKRKHPYTKKSWIVMVAEQFKYVILVLGNHDYWSANIHVEVSRIRQEIEKQGLQDKVFLLDGDTLVLDQVKFVGGTLWTDYNRANPMVMLAAVEHMNDYNYIRAGNDYRKARPRDMLLVHQKQRKYIFENAKKDSPDQRLVVVTHHAPSYQSIHPRYRTGRGVANYFYYSDLDAEIDTSEIELWFHGHCHCVSDYTIGNTRVICNPRGYRGHEDTSWNPQLRIEV